MKQGYNKEKKKGILQFIAYKGKFLYKSDKFKDINKWSDIIASSKKE